MMGLLYWSGVFMGFVGAMGMALVWFRFIKGSASLFKGLLAVGAFALGAALVSGYVLSWKSGLMPMSGAEDSFALLGWTLMLSSLYLSRLPRFLGLSALLGMTGVLSTGVAVFLPERTLPSLSLVNAFVFSLHVLVLFLAVSSFVIAFLSGLFYLAAQRDLKHRRFSRWLAFIPSLDALDQVVVGSVKLGAIALLVVMISGIYLAHSAWSTNWITDPKFILTSITCAWYFLLLGLRGLLGWRGGRFFFMMVIGFLLLMITFVGAAIFFASRESSYAIQELWRFAWIWS